MISPALTDEQLTAFATVEVMVDPFAEYPTVRALAEEVS